MKLLYVCGTYCPSFGGAEISMHTLIKQLKNSFGAEVLAVTDKRYTNNQSEGTYDGVNLARVQHNNREKEIESIIASFKPDAIITQLMWSDIALKIGKLKNIPTILRVCKIPFNLDISKKSEFSPTEIIAVSNAVSSYILKNFSRDSIILHPPVSLEKVLVSNHIKDYNPWNSEYILMFNPLGRKGGRIFKEIVQSFPNKKFAVVAGWASLKDPKTDEFSEDLLKRICYSLRTEYSGKKPEYVDFSNCPNVTILNPTEDVWKIYSKTKILLIPSQWEEAFGRVALEGLANGIPTLGSNVGGLKEALGSGGIIIDNYQTSSEWVSKIKKLDKKEYYSKISKMSKGSIDESIILDNVVKDFFNLLIKAINKFKVI